MKKAGRGEPSKYLEEELPGKREWQRRSPVAGVGAGLLVQKQ